MSSRDGIVGLMVVTMLLLLASCHKNIYNDDIYGSTSTTKNVTKKNSTTKSVDGTSSQVPAEWRTLDVKLERGDNKGLYKEIKSWLGTPYKYGAMKKGVACDCSGFVLQVYLAVYDKPIERNSARIFERNCKEVSRGELREGDLVFFHGGSAGRITHVGIYLKEGYFAHTSSSSGVIISSLDQRYYVKHWQCGGRVR